MTSFHDALGQSIGCPLDGWTERLPPPRTAMEGRYCRVEPIDPGRHAAELHEVNGEDAENRIWTYLPYGPFETLSDYRNWMDAACTGDDPLFHAVIDLKDGKAAGLASYLRITPRSGSSRSGTSISRRACKAPRPEPRPCT